MFHVKHFYLIKSLFVFMFCFIQSVCLLPSLSGFITSLFVLVSIIFSSVSHSSSYTCVIYTFYIIIEVALYLQLLFHVFSQLINFIVSRETKSPPEGGHMFHGCFSTISCPLCMQFAGTVPRTEVSG